MAQGYKGFAQIAREANKRLEELKKQKSMDPLLEERGFIGPNDITSAEYAWEMRKTEYQQIKAIEKNGSPMVLNHADGKQHEYLITEAIKAGKEIPEEVLQDYPWLKAEMQELETVKETESISQTEQPNLLMGDAWFEQNPTKILGEQYETTDRFGKPTAKVKGSMDDVIAGIDVPSVDVPVKHVEALESNIKGDVEHLVKDKVYKENIEHVVQKTKKERAEKELQKAINPDAPMVVAKDNFSFDDIMQQYNKGLTDDEIKAWVWYKRKTNGYNDETVVLAKKNGWSK